MKTLGSKIVRQRTPNLRGHKKTGVDDYAKKKGAKALAKKLKEAETTPVVGVRGGDPVIESFADIKQEDVVWLWENRIACGMLNALVGNPGEGKSTMALHIAALGSRGELPWPKGAKCEPFSTLYMSNENSHKHTSKPWFLAMGGDEMRMFALTDVTENGVARSVTLDDADVIEKAIRKTGAKLLVLDPLQSYIGDVNMHMASQTRAKLDPLIRVAERTGCAVLVVAHSPKQSGTRAIHAMLGSVDIMGAMRMAMLIGTSPENRDDRALLLGKHSVGPWMETLGFRIVKKPGAKGVQVEFTGTSALTYADFIAAEKPKTQSQPVRAKAWLREALAKGPRLMTDLVGASEFTERVLQIAAKGLVKRSRRGGKNGPMEWSLLPPGKFEGPPASRR